jgi:uncharacterized protein
MKILVDRLDVTPSELHFERDARWWESVFAGVSAPDLHPLGGIHFDLSAYKMGDDLLLAGSARADVELECSRCLSRYRHALRESFRLMLEPAGERTPSDPEGVASLSRDGVWLGDDLEAGWYRGPEIDLEFFCRELLALALPVQPLCRESCLGLCPQCGGDRNTTRCECAEPKPASPFAVLAELKGRLRGSKGES